jgi:hypothetical protein
MHHLRLVRAGALEPGKFEKMHARLSLAEWSRWVAIRNQRVEVPSDLAAQPGLQRRRGADPNAVPQRRREEEPLISSFRIIQPARNEPEHCPRSGINIPELLFDGRSERLRVRRSALLHHHG